MNRLGPRGLLLQALAAAGLLFGVPGLLGMGVYIVTNSRAGPLAWLLFALDLLVVAGALGLQWSVVRRGVVSVVLPILVVAFAPEGPFGARAGIALTLIVVFTYLFRDWERWAARVAGGVSIVLVFVAAHPPLIAHGPYVYRRMVDDAVALTGPAAPFFQALVSGPAGTAIHTFWLALVVVATLTPSLLQLDILVDVLRRARDHVRAEEPDEG